MISLVQKLPKYNHNAAVFTINLHQYEKLIILVFRFNCSFNPLTFTKLRFWSLRKKLQNGPLCFASVTVLTPNVNFDSVNADVAP